MCVKRVLSRAGVVCAAATAFCCVGAPASSENRFSEFQYQAPSPVFSTKGGYEPKGKPVLTETEFGQTETAHVSRYHVSKMPKIDNNAVMLTKLVLSQRVKYRIDF